MKNNPVNICKVTLTVSRIPKEVVLSIQNAIGTDNSNSYSITVIAAPNGEMKVKGKPKIITKANMLHIPTNFKQSEIACTRWCLEDQLDEAKQSCMEKMESAIKGELEKANTMSELFQEYKSKLKPTI